MACRSPTSFEAYFPRKAGVFVSCGVQISIQQNLGGSITLKEAKFIMEGIEKAALCRHYREEAIITVGVRRPGDPVEYPITTVKMQVVPSVGNSSIELSDLDPSATTCSTASPPVGF